MAMCPPLPLGQLLENVLATHGAAKVMLKLDCLLNANKSLHRVQIPARHDSLCNLAHQITQIRKGKAAEIQLLQHCASFPMSTR